MDFVAFVSGLQPMTTMKALGLVVMHGVFVLLLVRQLIRYLQTGNAEFLPTLLHYVLGLLCVSYLPEIGKSLVYVTRAVSETIYADQSIADFIATETEAVKEREENPAVALASFLNGRTYIRFVARVSIYLMLIVKVVMIDIIWQIFFAMATMLGALTIPISLIFGGTHSTPGFECSSN